MTIPALIEYISSIERPTGGQIAQMGAIQIRIPVITPGQIVQASVAPAAGTYAWIGYRLFWDPRMVPDAFNGNLYHGGHFMFEGTLSAAVLAEGVSAYFVVTTTQPMRYWAQNVTMLNQFDEVNGEFLTVQSEEDLLTIYKHLKDLTTSGFSDLAVSAANLLCVLPSGTSQGFLGVRR